MEETIGRMSMLCVNTGINPGNTDLNGSNVSILENKDLFDSNSRHPHHCIRISTIRKAKRVRFFRNGDRFYNGIVVAITPERYRSFDSLISDLTRALVSNVTLPNGVRTIYTMDGKRVHDICELGDGQSYVVSGQGEVFKKVDYSSSSVRKFTSLSGLTSTSMNVKQLNSLPACVKARIITLIRNGIKPRKIVRLLLNKRNSQTIDHIFGSIAEVVNLDTGAVRKVYSLSGQLVTVIEQFFSTEDIFVAYGIEKSAPEDFELDFEEAKFVQSFRKSQCSLQKYNGPIPKMPTRKMDGKSPVQTPSSSTSISNFPVSLTSQYIIGPVIGDGNFSVVRECVNRNTSTCYAMKIVDKFRCQGKESMLAREVAILRQVSHPNIISLLDVQETNSCLFLIMELIKGGDLFDAIASVTKFPETDASTMISHLCYALAYLHSQNIVHRDVKPENLLVQMNGKRIVCLKLADFGLAQTIQEPLFTICGTPTYVAPEILAEIGYGLKIDIWATGIILYILLCGFPPFVSTDNEQEKLFERILSGQYEYPSPFWDDISLSAKELISNMLQAQPELRFSAEDVLDHPWILEANQPLESRNFSYHDNDSELNAASQEQQ